MIETQAKQFQIGEKVGYYGEVATVMGIIETSKDAYGIRIRAKWNNKDMREHINRDCYVTPGKDVKPGTFREWIVDDITHVLRMQDCNTEEQREALRKG